MLAFLETFEGMWEKKNQQEYGVPGQQLSSAKPWELLPRMHREKLLTQAYPALAGVKPSRCRRFGDKYIVNMHVCCTSFFAGN